MSRVEMIRERLAAALRLEHVEVEDESHRHRGHAGARAGGGHYRLLVVSPDFEGLGRLARHRLVYRAMGDAMRHDTIHALAIQALTPGEHAGAREA